MAQYLGIHKEEPVYIQEIARMAISSSLPTEWIEVVDRNDGVIYK